MANGMDNMRRLTLSTLVILALATPLSGCGMTGATQDKGGDATPPPQSTPGAQPWQAPDGGVMVTCSDGLPFPADTVASGGIQVDPQETEAIFTALADLKEVGGIDAPMPLQQADVEEVNRAVLWMDDATAERSLGLLISPSNSADFSLETDWYVVLGRQGEQLRATSWQSSCSARPALTEGDMWATLALSPDTSTPEDKTVNLRVSEADCTGARDPAPFLATEPVVLETEDEVTVYWTSQLIQGGADCPSNPWVERTLQLDQVLGDRTLLDGSTWPPAPITLETANN